MAGIRDNWIVDNGGEVLYHFNVRIHTAKAMNLYILNYPMSYIRIANRNSSALARRVMEINLNTYICKSL